MLLELKNFGSPETLSAKTVPLHVRHAAQSRRESADTRTAALSTAASAAFASSSLPYNMACGCQNASARTAMPTMCAKTHAQNYEHTVPRQDRRACWACAREHTQTLRRVCAMPRRAHNTSPLCLFVVIRNIGALPLFLAPRVKFHSLAENYD